MRTRLSVVDELFLWTHDGLGLPVVMQGVWRTDTAVTEVELEQLCEKVAAGRLGRRVRRSSVPGARPAFVADRRRYRVDIDGGPVERSGVVDWADAQALVSVDPRRGPGWRISAVRVVDGGTIVSVTCSHVIADARGLIHALDDAMHGRSPETTAARAGSDLRDAVGTLARVGFGLTRAVAGLIGSRARRAELRRFTAPTRPATERPGRAGITSAIFEIDAKQWDTAATCAGGTPNSLFLACVGELARRAEESGEVTLSVPMNVRMNTAGVENAVAMVAVPLRPDTSVTEIRRLCRDAFAAPPMSSPANFPEELLQVLPDRLARRLVEGPGQRDALGSNIGDVPVTGFGSHRTAGLAVRAVHPGVTTAQLNATPTRISGYLCLREGVYTLSLVSFESSDNQELRTRGLHVLSKFGLSAAYW
ncbi:hypothetical protein ABH922_000672 [Rhodococcus sp. 27YEA15]|uniref:hypothetical protein n=1 Tax=Rhodococcus sp. 27YEA15 TaxID=3156259 RepID=UPI003C7C2C3C